MNAKNNNAQITYFMTEKNVERTWFFFLPLIIVENVVLLLTTGFDSWFLIFSHVYGFVLVLSDVIAEDTFWWIVERMGFLAAGVVDTFFVRFKKDDNLLDFVFVSVVATFVALSDEEGVRVRFKKDGNLLDFVFVPTVVGSSPEEDFFRLKKMDFLLFIAYFYLMIDYFFFFFLTDYKNHLGQKW